MDCFAASMNLTLDSNPFSEDEVSSTIAKNYLPILKKIPPYLPILSAGLFLVYLYYAYTCYLQWEIDFGCKRVARNQSTSPSNNNAPEVKSWESNKTDVLSAAKKYSKAFVKRKSLRALRLSDIPKSGMNPQLKANAIPSAFKRGSLSNKKAKKLNMDHVYIPLAHYIWALTFIGPQAMFLWVKGLSGLWLRQVLCKLGIFKPKPYDCREIVGRLCLEGTMAIHYYAKTEDDIAGFFFSDFPIIAADGNVKLCDLFSVDIDLKTKRMVKAKLDDKDLTPEETLILCWFNTIAMQHVKLHSLANWGVNNEPDQWEHDWFVAQNSLVTAMYNYFGYTCFGKFMKGWTKLGFLKKDVSPAWNKCIDIGINSGIWAHPNIRELSKYSRMVNFITKVRSIFMTEFAKHKKCFPGVHGEAMFVGTVMHSLDHTIMDINLEDPMWLDVDHPEFGYMAEIGRIVKVGFVSDVDGLYFHKRFKGSGHPFYERVYAKAAKIDKFFADNMDTCIIK